MTSAKSSSILNAKHKERLAVMREVISGERTQIRASFELGISPRQVRRIAVKLRVLGDFGVLHGTTGKPSKNRIDEAILQSTKEFLLEPLHHDFGASLATEKLKENGVLISKESVRKLQILLGLHKPKRRKTRSEHHSRERRPRFGELIQIDGSPHKWLEERGDACCLLVFIDDATGKITSLLFVEHENMAGYLQALKIHINQYGVPVCLYSDRHGIFRVNAKESVSGDGKTEFGRCMERLNIKQIQASTPQAKGRVERANQTLQDRLVKELRLKNISNIADANDFLPEFMDDFNRKFARVAKEKDDAHRPLTLSDSQLELALSVQETRVLSKNLSFSHNATRYLVRLKKGQFGTSMRGGKITLYTAPDKVLRASYKGQMIEFTAFCDQPKIADTADEKSINYQVNQMLKLAA